MKNTIHLINIPFTGLGLHNGFRGNAWFKHRIEVFKNYTLKSLMNQTNQEFVIWLCFRPEEENNPLTKELKRYLRDMYPFTDNFIFTFHGITIWDDKYPNDKLLDRLYKTLPELKEFINKDWVYLTNLASDDMYSEDMVEHTQAQKPEYKKAFGYPVGYILNAETHQIAEYNPITHAPFYTIVFPKDVFLNPVKHYNYLGPYKSHEEVPDNFNYVKTDDFFDRKYCVLVHGDNISTVWNIPYKGREIKGEEKQEVFKKFGIVGSVPIKTRTSLRLKLRSILNLLPFRNLLKRIYYVFR